MKATNYLLQSVYSDGCNRRRNRHYWRSDLKTKTNRVIIKTKSIMQRNMFIIKCICLLLLAGWSLPAGAQNTANNFNAYMPQMPYLTPESASLGKYGEIPVSEYTGVPEISIPPLHGAGRGTVAAFIPDLPRLGHQGGAGSHVGRSRLGPAGRRMHQPHCIRQLRQGISHKHGLGGLGEILRSKQCAV